MIVRARVWIFLTFVASGCTTTGSKQILFNNTTYSLVSGSELRSSFVDKKVRYPDPRRLGDIVLSNSIRCDAFYQNGRYVTCGHRITRPTGTYEVQKNRVCIDLYSRIRCVELYRSQGGDYLLRNDVEGAV